MRGAATVWPMPDSDLRAVAFTIAAYLLMHYVYAYVDMSWDGQSMLYVGTAFGLIGVLERLSKPPLPPVVTNRLPGRNMQRQERLPHA